ncbi:hypothetical protein [Persephonella sp.]
MSATKTLPKKKIKLDIFENDLNTILKNYGLKSFNIYIPKKPDEEGIYFISVRTKDNISIKKAIDMAVEINKNLRNKYGENIYLDIIPE